MLHYIGSLDDLGIERALVKITDQMPGEPLDMPFLHWDESFICALGMGDRTDLYVVRTLEEAQELWYYSQIGSSIRTITIDWYLCPTSLVAVLPVTDGRFSNLAEFQSILYVRNTPMQTVITMVTDKHGVRLPAVLVNAIEDYALGNFGVASKLTHLALTFTTVEQLEKLVGWPLSEHSASRVSEIWDRFRS